jgi:riboflavin kinase/FMN adenylyltransferase
VTGPGHMEVVPGVEALRPGHGRLFIVVGVFDGLHRGHVYLLRHLRAEAARLGARPTVITFDAHPDEIVRGHAPPLLLDPAERLVRLDRAGVEVGIVQHFDEAVRETPYDAFVQQIRERVELAGLLMTPDAAFGYQRRGTPDAIAALGGRLGFELVVVPPLELHGRAVRSAEIRREVAEGDLAGARDLLGRSLAVVGTVADRPGPREHTPDRLVELTFPVPVALPPPGTYAVMLERAWERTVARDPRSLAARAIVQEGEPLRIERRGELPAGDRLRVAFRDGPLGVARLPVGPRA